VWPGACTLSPATDPRAGYVVRGPAAERSSLGTELMVIETAYPDAWAPGTIPDWALHVAFRNWTPQLVP